MSDAFLLLRHVPGNGQHPANADNTLRTGFVQPSELKVAKAGIWTLGPASRPNAMQRSQDVSGAVTSYEQRNPDPTARLRRFPDSA
jgi:hypothetical protein